MGQHSVCGDEAKLLEQVKEVLAQPVLADQAVLGSLDVVAVVCEPCAGRRGGARDPACGDHLSFHDRSHLHGEPQVGGTACASG